MKQHVFSRRRVAGGLTCAAAGAMALVLSVGSPAGATEGPQVETGRGWSADDLADRFGGQWAEAEVPAQSGRHLLDDRGTPDTGDDAYVDVQVGDDGEISWSSDDVEIGAVEVPGGEQSQLFTYGGGHGSRHGEFEWGGHGGRDRGDRGWGGGHGRGGFKFCWKNGGGGGHQPPPTHPPTTPTHPPTTAPPTTAPPTTAPPTTAPPETTTTAPPETTTTLPQTEATTPTTQPAGEQLPRTGSTTMPLVVGAIALLGLGAAAFFGRRYLQQRA